MSDLAPEDIPQMVQEIKESFNQSDELDLFRNADNLMKEANRRREKENTELKNTVDALQLSLLSLQKEHEKSRDNWKSSSHHLAEVHKMESEKFSFAKKTNELQSKLSQLENEIQEVKRKVREIELKEVGQEEGDELDQEAIALSVFRKMGWTPSTTSSNSNQNSQVPFDAILARSDSKQNVISVNVTDSHIREMGLSPFAVADQLWRAVE